MIVNRISANYGAYNTLKDKKSSVSQTFGGKIVCVKPVINNVSGQAILEKITYLIKNFRIIQKCQNL